MPRSKPPAEGNDDPRARQATITVSELRRSPGRVLQRVTKGGEHLIVESDGRKVAVILPYPDYQQLVREWTAHKK